MGKLCRSVFALVLLAGIFGLYPPRAQAESYSYLIEAIDAEVTLPEEWVRGTTPEAGADAKSSEVFSARRGIGADTSYFTISVEENDDAGVADNLDEMDEQAFGELRSAFETDSNMTGVRFIDTANSLSPSAIGWKGGTVGGQGFRRFPAARRGRYFCARFGQRHAFQPRVRGVSGHRGLPLSSERAMR